MRARLWVRLVVVWIFATGIVSCARSATQLVVVVSTDIASLTELYVTVARVEDPASAPSDATLRLPAEARSVSFGVTPPEGDPRRRVEVIVAGRDASGRDVVTRRVRTGFLPEQTLELPIFLADACRSVDCATMGADLDCDRGACVNVEVPPDRLTPFVPLDAGEVGPDAGSRPTDAGPADTGPGGTCPTTTELPSTGPISVGLAALPSGAHTLVAYHDGARATARFVRAAGGETGSVVVSEGASSVDGTSVVGLTASAGVVAISRMTGVDAYSVEMGTSPAAMFGHEEGLRLSGASARWRDGVIFAAVDRADGSPKLWIAIPTLGTMRVSSSPLPTEPADVALDNTASGDLVVAVGAHGATTECTVAIWNPAAPAPTLSTVPTGGSTCSYVAVAWLSGTELAVGWSDASAVGVDAQHVAKVRLEAGGGLTEVAPGAVLPSSIHGRPIVLGLGGEMIVGRRTSTGLAFSRGTALGTRRDLRWGPIAPLPGEERGVALADRITVLQGFQSAGTLMVVDPCLP